MGIKGLWGVLNPYSEKKSLHEIQGETIAVDLAGWICDSQNVTEYYIQPKLYLSQIQFPLKVLFSVTINKAQGQTFEYVGIELRQDCFSNGQLYVAPSRSGSEGEAPELKREVMAARNAIQFRGAAPKTAAAKSKQPSVTRKRFKGVLKECESLLKSMGVRCVKGRGEAEATCARLNAKGLVNAVVSQDSDCFAYGAKRVYRNFSVSSSAGGGAMQGSVDCYDAEKMYENNGFGRKKMVALALLCGSDYGSGACGSSITTAVTFLHTVPEDEVIHRLLSWVTETEYYEEKARWTSAPGRCDRCGHVGRTHAKNGCPVCVSHKGCTDLGHKSKVAEVKREVSLRNRALSCGMPFPEPKVMKEFMDATPEDIDLNSLKIPTPSLIQFVKIMTYKLEWTERYCVEKFLPLLTKWHLQEKVPSRSLQPVEIKKKRNPKGVPSFEVLWKDIDGQYEALIPDNQFEDGEDLFGPWTSIERQDLMRLYYPEVVEKYEESIKKPPKVKKTKGRIKKDIPDQKQNDKPKRKYNRKPKQLKDVSLSNLNESLKILNLTNKDFNTSKANVSVSINKLKRKIKSNAKTKTKNTIDSYLQPHKKRKSSKLVQSLKNSFRNLSIVNSDKENVPKEDKHLLSMFNMSGDDINENDLSAIVDNIVSRPTTITTAKVNSNYVKLIFENKRLPRKSILTERFNQNNCSTPKNSPVKIRRQNTNASRRSTILKANTSYFFDKLTEERDAFEMSMEYKHKTTSINPDCNETLDYSFRDV